MKIIFSLAFLLLKISIGYSQTKEIILVIDTIEGRKFSDSFIPFVNFDGFADLPKIIDTENLSMTKFPNFVSKKILIHDTSTITIPISKDKDLVTITGLSKLKNDTLRISKILMKQNDLPDTIYTIKEWYIQEGDSLYPSANKEKSRKIVAKKPRSKKSNSEYILYINGVRYSSKLSIIKGATVISHGHGKKPDESKGKEGKGEKRFTTNSETIHWIYKASFEL